MTFFFYTISINAQSWDSVKENSSYLTGEGWGATVAEADQNALADLISKISVVVESEFTSISDEALTNGNLDSKQYVSSKVNTYSTATLKNTERIIINNEPDAHVGRWIKKSEVNRIFVGRENKVKDFVEAAQRAEKSAKIDDALRYYYWAFTLLKTLQHPAEVKYVDDEGGEYLLQVWLPEQINSIFGDIKVAVLKNEDGIIDLGFTFRGMTVGSLDYTYFDGRDWSNLYSAKDGRGILELSSNAMTNNLQLKFEYEYRNESHIDKELESVMKIVRSKAMRKSYITINGDIAGDQMIVANQPSAVTPVAQTNEVVVTTPTQNEAPVLVQQKERSTNSVANSTKIVPPKPAENSNSCATILDQVVKAIQQKNYAIANTYFTAEGAQIYQKLITYGNARVIGEPNYLIYESGNSKIARGLTLSFSFKNNLRKAFVEDIVFTFNQDNKISNLAFGLGEKAESDILHKGVWTERARVALMEFLENYKTAYALKRIDYINSIFDDDAVIIVGNMASRLVNKANETAMSYYDNQYVKYTRMGKGEYLKKLASCFKSNEFINIRFSNNDVIKLGKGGELYGIQIKQDYYSSNYGDTGYLFLMVDLNDPEKPLIKVRTWQPDKDPNFGIIGAEFF